MYKFSILRTVTFAVCFAVIISGCTSSSGSSNRPLPQEPAELTNVFSVDGQWELPDGQTIMLFKGHSFILFARTGKVVLNGLFSLKDNQIILNLPASQGRGFITLNYSRYYANLRINSESGNTWMNGLWRINNGLINETGNNPLIGYWESRNEERIHILHILPGGWGLSYYCDFNYHLIRILPDYRLYQADLSYDDNKPYEFDLIFDLEVDGIPLTAVATTSYIFDGADLLLGDITSDYRFIKK